MASSLLALLDDMAALLDDAAVVTKVAAPKSAAAADDVPALTERPARKAAGAPGDELALSAQQVTGLSAGREMPVLWRVAKGAMRNKLFLVPAALVISVIAPWVAMPLLIVGGAFLCFEGFDKVRRKFMPHTAETATAPEDEAPDWEALEDQKVKGAVRTDFVLSAGIIAITLGAVASQPIPAQLAVLSLVALLMTVGVYGLVAGIVALDDFGLYLSEQAHPSARRAGQGILCWAPWLMRALSVVGAVAMLLVGGGIVVHSWPWLHHLVQGLVQAAPGGLGQTLMGAVCNAVVGLLAGVLTLAVVVLSERARARWLPRLRWLSQIRR